MSAFDNLLGYNQPEGEALEAITAADHRWFVAHPAAPYRQRLAYPVEFEPLEDDPVPGATYRARVHPTGRPMCHEVAVYRFTDRAAWQYLGTVSSQYDAEAAARALAVDAGEVDL